MNGISNLTNNTQQAFLTEDFLHSFTSGVSAQTKLDALDVTLFAKLHADEYNFFTQRDSYYNSYKEIFERLNFEIEETFFQQIQIQQNLKVYEYMLNSIYLSEEEAEVTENAILSLGPHGDNQDILNNTWRPYANSNDKNYGSCKILATSIEQNVIEIKQSFFHLTSFNFNLNIDFLWEVIAEARVDILERSVLVVRIAIEDYANIRTDVASRVEDARNFIHNVTLTHPRPRPQPI